MKFYSILKLSWTEMSMSDYFYKSNSRRKVIEMEGVDCADSVSNESAIVIMYNMMTGCPLVLTEKFYGELDKNVVNNLDEAVSAKFNVTVETGEDGDGKYTEIICIRKSFYDAVTESENSV